ncbi:MAG: hypothetical protein AB1486_30395 [Planctomycetota bacterium]
MHHVRNNSTLTLLLLSFLGAFVVAFVFVVTFTYWLPPSDEAYGQAPFEDPLVFPVMSVGASICGSLAFPLAFWLLRRVYLGRSFVVVLLSALAGNLLITPFLGILGVPGVFLAMIGAMFFCRWKYSVPRQPASNTAMQSAGAPRGR